jgi:hypothetical protein
MGKNTSIGRLSLAVLISGSTLSYNRYVEYNKLITANWRESGGTLIERR